MVASQTPSGADIYVTSRYNFSVPVANGVLLYNASTGAVLQFRGIDAAALSALLSTGICELEEGNVPNALWMELVSGGFLVTTGTDELELIRARFAKARGETPVVLTLTTTMDCNLGCYYCYEERSGERLKMGDVESIVRLARQRLEAHPCNTLHVDWYGGEPLLNIDFVETASAALQAMCDDENFSYHASIISNGTVWPDDVGAFISRARIRQVQISFDGMRNHHDRRRRFRPGRSSAADASSFDLIVALVDKLVHLVRVDLRFNMDRQSQSDLLPFIDFARSRGWLGGRFPVTIQPARLASYSKRSEFLRANEISQTEFDVLRGLVRTTGGADVHLEESESPDGFPYPRNWVCAALASRSAVVGADGLLYRCGLQVGERNRATGSLLQRSDSFPDATWWEEFDPTRLPTCSRCSFLPVCWGGCPKKHLDGDGHALDEQSIYWRQNLPRLVATHFGLVPPPDFSFTESDQFR